MEKYGIGILRHDIVIETENDTKKTKFELGFAQTENEFLYEKYIAIGDQAEKLEGLKAGQQLEITGMRKDSGFENPVYVYESDIIHKGKILSNIDQNLLNAVENKSYSQIKDSITKGADVQIISKEHLSKYSTDEKNLFKEAAKEGIRDCGIGKNDFVNTISNENKIKM
ncbi:MAG: hypothetical protein A2275_05765 [Bacteroidetes bacterium RIFOXYA12_FULL_35_11]|nr:MAG: hypothetical protein A2X01_10925 [Bacteroidetes bacterium GWF2_35_48]OFY74988.1 MAG: hypothetical protein A2275_05765 [Bacteroidetes bacterium RIFOXYA12_FULL_35_11]OFY99562.1 MAG: hypothetical protein A2491_08335 [Bacteroidetes bacterium RIFOXYC12_FULL_35_7]HBX52817.1 hypothetical protein [Bacteroidales bacterium]